MIGDRPHASISSAHQVHVLLNFRGGFKTFMSHRKSQRAGGGSQQPVLLPSHLPLVRRVAVPRGIQGQGRFCVLASPVLSCISVAAEYIQ